MKPTPRPGRCSPPHTLLFALVALCLLLTASCTRDRPIELRIGVNLWPVTEYFSLAKERGFFAAEQLDVRLLDYQTLGDTRAAFEARQIDAFSGTLIEVLLTRETSNRSPRIVLVNDSSDGADVILARSEITSVAALKGRRVGMETGAFSSFELARALDRAGLKFADVQTVAVFPQNMPAKLASGAVDAVVAYPPASTLIEKDQRVNRVFTSAEIPGEIVDLLAVDSPVLDRVPDLPARLARVFQRAQDYTRENPKEAYAFMAAREGLSPEEFAAAFTGIRVFTAADQAGLFRGDGMLRKVIPKVVEVLRSVGALKRSHEADDLLPRGPG